MRPKTGKRLIAAACAAALGLAAGHAAAVTQAKEPQDIRWSFDGPFGTFDQAQLQRGYKVYREVCSNCHSMNLLAFRNLGDKGGPFWSPKYPNPNQNPYVKSIAADYQIDDIDSETGDPVKRKGATADHFPAPYPNAAAAAAGNGGAAPPDLSVMAKAREGGPRYIYSLLTGFAPAPAGLKVNPGQYYNPYYPGDLSSYWSGDKRHVPEGGFIHMPPPLKDGLVAFDDGHPDKLTDEAKDVAAFLAWASDPKATERKQTGLAVLIYLVLFAGVVYLSYRRIWRNVAH